MECSPGFLCIQATKNDHAWWLDGASDGAEVLVENNYFENSAKPHWNQGSGYFSASGNIYTGRSATDQYRDNGATVFSDVQLYPYRLDNANTLGSQVDGGTGPQ